MTFAEILRAKRMRAGLTLDACAALLGISRRCLAKWEAGTEPLQVAQEGTLERLKKVPDKAARPNG